jgi:hypothetical protein
MNVNYPSINDSTGKGQANFNRKTSMSSPDERQIEPDEESLRAWVDDDFVLRVAVKCENDQWFALLMDFDITGSGESTAVAVRDAFGLLGAYLTDYYMDGASFGDTLRPIPLGLNFRIRVESAIGAALRHAAVRSRLSHESTYALPPGLIPSFAH